MSLKSTESNEELEVVVENEDIKPLLTKEQDEETDTNPADQIMNTLVISSQISDGQLYINIVKMTIMWT